MIAFLKGRIVDISGGSVILDVNGVGYEVLISGQTAAMLEGVGQELEIFTYMQVHEEQAVLFGFLTRDDLQMFKLLIGVNGIGPKAGLSIITTLGASELRFAILADDAKKISKSPGIGFKTAQKIILDLKDKMDMEDAFQKKLESDLLSPEAAAAAAGSKRVQEAVQALVALGYGSTEALKAIRAAKTTSSMSVEDIIKVALKEMASM